MINTVLEANNPFVPAYRRPPAPAPYYGGGEQPPQPSHLRNVALFGGALAGIGAAGFIPMRGGRAWDIYLRGVRQFEELSPLKIFRTFRYSELLSPFGTYGTAGTFRLPSEAFTNIIQRAGREIPVPNIRMRRFMAQMIGRPLHELEAAGAFTRGLEFRRTGALLGEIGVIGGKTLSGAALPMKAGGPGAGTFMDWFARTTGMNIGRGGVTGLEKPAMMAITVPKVDKVLGIPLSQHAALRMQKLRLVGRYTRAYWAGQIGRLNRLLTAPLEMFPAAGRAMSKLGVSVAIKEGTAMQMLGRYTRKGLLIGAGYTALRYLSYLRSRAEGRVGPGLAGTAMGGLFGLLWRKSPRGALIGAAAGLIAGVAPIFDRGLIEGAATAGVRAHMGYAQYVSEPLGLTRAAREQEALMPGITQAKTALGLTAGGMLAGLFTRGAARLAMLRKAGGHEALAESLTSFQEAMRAEAGAATGLFGRARALLWPQALKGEGALTRIGVTGGRLGAAAGALAFTAFAVGAAFATKGLPGILGTKKTAEELEDIYTGREEVPIKKGRWWEFGRSPYEGTRTMYYRPHAYHLMMTGAKTKGLYGSEEEYWQYNPWLHPVKALFDEEFKYHWERKYYHERPAPITGTWGEDIPFIGPLLAATVGRVIKRPLLMHTEKWLKDEEALHVPTTGEEEPTIGLQRGMPVSPYRLDQMSGEMIYRINELRGLTGFMHGAIKEHLTGSQDYFDQLERLEPASRAYSAAKWWYEQEYGGLLTACWIGDTRVVTANGRKPIKEVQVGEKVVGLDGVLREVVNKYEYLSDNLYRLKVSSLDVELTGTGNHQIPVYEFSPCHDRNSSPCVPGNRKHCEQCTKVDREIRLVDKHLEDIKKGDFVALPIIRGEENVVLDLADFLEEKTATNKYVYARAGQGFAKAFEWLEEQPVPLIRQTRAQLRNLGISDRDAKEAIGQFRKGHSPKRWSRFLEIDEEIAEIMGWYVAEGCVDEAGGFNFILNKTEYEVAERLLSLISAKFGNSGNIYEKEDADSISAQIQCIPLARACKKLFGGRAPEKKIPYMIKKLNKQKLKAFFLAAQQGDGWIKPSTLEAGYTSASCQLCRDMLDIGLKLGLKGYITADYEEIPHEDSRYPQGDLRKITLRSYITWSRSAVGAMSDWMNLKSLPYSNKHNSRSFIHRHLFFVRVKSVEPIEGQEVVYDLQVKDLPYYVAEHIIVHNSEPIRRFIPRERRFDYYNPIANLQPKWLPSGRSYYIDFQRGMPETTVALGEMRLPGAGYAALNPEVAGLAPEQYPLYHRFRILADVAMWSNEYKQANQQITAAMRRGELSEAQVAEVRKIRARISERKKRRRFQQYQFTEDALEKIRVTVSQQIKPGTFETDEHGVFKLSGIKMAHDSLASKNAETIGSVNHRMKQIQVSDYLRDYIYPGAELDVYVHKDPLHRYTASGQPAAVMAGGANIGQELVGAGLAEWEEESPFAAQARFGGAARGLGALWERVAHAEPFWEHMQPLSPMAKFIHQRTALEEYERNRLYSRDIAMWQHPVAHFLRPAYLMATAGEGEIPEEALRQRQIEDYFDKLKWLKYRTLETVAAKAGNEEATKEFRDMQRRTLFGVNPYGSTAFIYSALPSLDRDFFQEFADADSAAERQKILSLIPVNQRPVYIAQWQNRLAKSLIAQKRMGVADQSAYAHLDALRLSKITEGRPVDPKLWREYRRERPQDVSYADWSRIRELRDYFKQHPMPKPSFVGFHPHVDLEDVKLKLVQQEGLDMHDFNLWQSRARTFARKPYLEHALENMQGGSTDPVEAMRRIESVLRDTLGLKDVSIRGSRVPGGNDYLDLVLSDDRADAIMKYKNDPQYQGIL